MNKETIEEAAEKYVEKNRMYFSTVYEKAHSKVSFISGAKCQQKQDKNKYSEEEVIELLKTFDIKFNAGIVERNKGIKEWFEQFKKK